jgi:hypothetical protein
MLPVEVMPVARKPDVFVRAVTPEEGRKLAQIARRSKQPIRMRRAVVVMASAQHQPVGLIAKLMQVSEAYVRQMIHDFNEKGFRRTGPKMERGQTGEDRSSDTGSGSVRSLGAVPGTWGGRSPRGACRSWRKCCGPTGLPTSAAKPCGRS